MDSFSFNNLQAGRANAILKHDKLRRITSLLRIIEVCVLVVLVSRFSMKLPGSVRNTSEYLREFSLFMNSPRFVFLIGNAIIITLFAQYGQFSAQGSAENVVQTEPDLYQEFLQKSTTKYREKQSIRTEEDIENRIINGEIEKSPENNENFSSIGESGYTMINGEINKFLENNEICESTVETGYGMKNQRIRTEDGVESKRINGEIENYPENKEIFPRTVETGYIIKSGKFDEGKIKWSEKQRTKTEEANFGLKVKKDYRRCETEVLSKPHHVLRRCETENGRKSIEASPAEDEMSNEEFRRIVEAFIAKEQRIRREEASLLV
uniref:CM0216.380.nc protein n=1 Tax=Lotus japonicus TaxID=34305 RepID=B0BLI4_LOTJA|nr:CM0216.380.nc [Lotus japonicus]